MLSDVKTVAVLNTPSSVPEVVAGQLVSQGRLPNSEILSSLQVHLSYLEPQNRYDVIELIHKYHALFSDVPTRTNVLQHDIDPIRQHPYRVNPENAMSSVKKLIICFSVGLLS